MVDDPSSDEFEASELHTTMESEVDAVMPDFQHAATPRVDVHDEAPTVPGELGSTPEGGDAPEPARRGTEVIPAVGDEEDKKSSRPSTGPPRPSAKPKSKRGPASVIPRPSSNKPTPMGMMRKPLSRPPSSNSPGSNSPGSNSPGSKAPGSKAPGSDAPPAKSAGSPRRKDKGAKGPSSSAPSDRPKSVPPRPRSSPPSALADEAVSSKLADSRPPAVEIDETDWLAPKDVAPEGMFASGDYNIDRVLDDPFARRSDDGEDAAFSDEAPGLDAPTVKMSALRDLDIGAFDDPNDDEPPLEDTFDGAKTQKLHRPNLGELRRVGAELGLVDDEGDDAPDDARDESDLPEPPAPEAPVDEPAPEDDGLDAPTMVVKPPAPAKRKKRKSRRGGRKRTAVKIPDDDTPMPPPVALADALDGLSDEVSEDEVSGGGGAALTSGDEGFLDEAAIEEVRDSNAPQPPTPPPAARERLQTLTGHGPATPPPPRRRVPDDDQEVTLLRPSPALQRALEQVREAQPASAPPNPPGPPGPTGPPEAPEPGSSSDAPGPSEATEAASVTSPSPASEEGSDPAASSLDVDGLPTPSSGGGLTPSAPGVMTDDASIGLVRPVQIVSDLPAVEELKQRTIEAAMAHQVASFEIEPGPESAEEIDAEPVEPPGPPPATSPAPNTGETASQRRPPPPRRASDQAIEAIEEIQPDRVSLPARQLPPPRSTEMSSAESDLALAEARAREAEAKAREAAARAAEADAKAKAAKASAPPKKPWWVEMFEADLIRTLANPRKKDVENDASFIEECLRLPKGSRILDLACGVGVHAVELSHRGFQVVGVDFSDKMLDLARAYNNQRGTSVSFIQGDMRKLNLEGVFDGIYCWSSSWGYFDENTNANVLERIARAVRPGGTFALDIDNRDFVAPRAPQMAWFEKPGVVCMDEMRFDFYSSRMITRRMAIFENQAPREIETTIRLYTLREMGRLLQKVGFRILEVSGHRATRGAYFGDVSPRIIICCQRQED